MVSKPKGSNRAGRPLKPGGRYPSGKLRPAEPPTPNERVVQVRRALLTGDPNSTEAVDITMAENALDLALARGWITTGRHAGAQRFAGLFRRAIGTLPSLRVAKPLSDRVSAPSALSLEEPTVGKSGVLTPEDYALQGRLAKAEVTDRERTLALKAHRRAPIDWSRVSPADLTAIFDAALSTGAYAGADPVHDDEADTRKLRALWSTMRPEQARELFDVAVLGSWPRWITMRIFGHAVVGEDRRRQSAFEVGVDRVNEQLAGRRPASAPAAPVPAPPPEPRVPVHEEHLNYVDTEGQLLFEVVRRSRRAGQ